MKKTKTKSIFELILILIFTLALFWSCHKLYAANGELDIGGFWGSGGKALKINSSATFETRYGIKMTPSLKFRSMTAGNMFNFQYGAKKDFNDHLDAFFAIDYLNDEIIKINKQLDYKIGAGLYLFKSFDTGHKVSYAVVYRGNTKKFLNSFRYKFYHNGRFISTKAIIYYITPDREVRGSLTTEFKLTESLALTYDYSFNEKNNLTNYLNTLGFKIKY